MRLTASDASFLYAETSSGPMHISSVVVIDGELDYDDVFKHFESRMHLLPAYRRKLGLVPMNIAHPVWVQDPDFDLKNHLIDQPMSEGTSLDEAIDFAVQINEDMLDRNKPLWMAHVIRGVPGKTLMLHQTHHCMIDGASGVELAAIIYDFDPEGDEVGDAKEEPEAKPLLPQQLFTEALNENISAIARTDWSAQLAPPNASQQAMVQRAAKVMSDFVAKPALTAPFNAGLVSPKRRLGWTKKSFDDIRSIRRALGGTINDIVLTVVSEAVAEYLAYKNENTADQYLRVMCPVNVRTEDQKGALGNRVSAIFPMLPAWSMATPLRLTSVIAETERIKQNGDAHALTYMQERAPDQWPVALWPTQFVGTAWDPTRFAANFPMPVMPQVGPRPPMLGYNFTCTNVPASQVPQYMLGKQVSDQIGLLILNGNVGFSVTILSYNKTLFFGFICEPRLLPEIERIVASADTAFENLLAAANERATTIKS